MYKTILAAGDWHGDARHAAWTMQRALDLGAPAIVQVGDFGYWEHEPHGVTFLDWLGEMAVGNELPIYWIDGNHENHTLLRARYGPGGDQYQPTPEGFWTIRDGVYYIPRGTRWTWNGITMMGLGGAYSIDKYMRLEDETDARRAWESRKWWHEADGGTVEPFDAERCRSWWPEEELTNAEVDAALADPAPIDILFTHDKPLASNPPWNRKAYQACLPNQVQIQRVVTGLQPKLLVHGHLHYRYTDQIRSSGDHWCRVEGLNCNSAAQSNGHEDAEESILLIHLQHNDIEADALLSPNA